jgi:hypothetical protein
MKLLLAINPENGTTVQARTRDEAEGYRAHGWKLIVLEGTASEAEIDEAIEETSDDYDGNEDRALLRERVNHLVTFHRITGDQAEAMREQINNLDDQVAVIWADAIRHTRAV